MNSYPESVNSSSIDIVKLVNEKCLHNLGHTVLKSMSTTVNNKIKVEYVNGETLNFFNYKTAFEYLNATYKLKIEISTKSKKKIIENEKENKKDTHKIDSAVKKLMHYISKFKNTSVKYNKVKLANYLSSYEWAVNKFTSDEINKIIDTIDEATDFQSRVYTLYIESYFNKA